MGFLHGIHGGELWIEDDSLGLQTQKNQYKHFAECDKRINNDKCAKLGDHFSKDPPDTPTLITI